MAIAQGQRADDWPQKMMTLVIRLNGKVCLLQEFRFESKSELKSMFVHRLPLGADRSKPSPESLRLTAAFSIDSPPPFDVRIGSRKSKRRRRRCSFEKSLPTQISIVAPSNLDFTSPTKSYPPQTANLNWTGPSGCRHKAPQSLGDFLLRPEVLSRDEWPIFQLFRRLLMSILS